MKLALAVILCAAVIEISSYRIYRNPGYGVGRGRYPYPYPRPGYPGYPPYRGGSNVDKSYMRGRNFKNNNYDNGASGAEGQHFHNSGTREHHNKGNHHSKVTKIEKSEHSGSHDIGSSESFNTGGGSGRNYNNYNKGASEAGNDYDRGQSHTGVW
ncbi:unnamed protein product [Pieris macdunnoughi]|uniref:Uncharacterized protein n=1 Tax=Pieris macdunnoughi TaxID=345717 RepID=A0A821V6J5_9NEOP|nr:unnamed protein product [Pieris macdunnoughi]